MSLETERTLWQKWVHFWFAAADPTTMAFIRIVTGVLILYIHLVYSLDLHSFFGKEAWYGLDVAERERKEMPWHVNSFWKWEWNDVTLTARLPEEPHRRTAVLNYLKSLPFDQPDELKKILRFLDLEGDALRNKDALQKTPAQKDLAPLQYDLMSKELINLLDYRPSNPPHPRMSRDPTARKGLLQALVDPKLRDAGEKWPEYYDRFPLEYRQQKAQDLEAFFLSLPEPAPRKPGTRAAADQYELVIEYFFELSPALRRNLVRFITELGQVSADERKERLEYIAYWNTEKQFAYRIGSPIFSIWYHITDPTEMVITHSLILVIMTCFTIGYQTRLMSVLTWLAAMSYLNRNPQILFGQDTMMNILLIYLMIANCGAALSVDRWLACRRARKLSLEKSGTIDAATAAYLAAPMPSPSAGLAQRMLQVHFCFIYMAAGLSKLKGSAWWNHNAFWDTLINPEFTMVHFQWYENILRQTAASRPVFAMIAATGVWFTLVLEIALPFLVWTRLRPYVIIMGFMLHAGVGVFMGLLIFSLLMMTMLVSFIPGTAIRAVLFPPAKKVT